MSNQRRSVNQAQVLDDIRQALGHVKTLAPAPLEPFNENGNAAETEALVARFTLELKAVGGHVYRVAPGQAESAGRVAAQVVEICCAAAGEVALSRSPAIAEMELAHQLAGRGLSVYVPEAAGPAEHDEVLARLANCDAGLTTVDYAIAETGTLVLSSNEGNALLVSLLPPVHIALLRSPQISASLGEVIAKLNIARADGHQSYRSATLITGPSRTSDVELTLSIGVHGPKQLHVIILD